MDREHTATIGNRAEARVLAALLDRYETVLLPYGGNCRYDLAIDTPEGFKRVQCKNGHILNGAIEFSTCSSTSHWKNGGKRPYYGQADLFGVYCPTTGHVYLVPVDECGGSSAKLRLDPPKNRQAKRIRLAADYQVN